MSAILTTVLGSGYGMSATSAAHSAHAPGEDVRLEALVRGDAAALTQLYRQHHEAVRAFVRRLLADTAAVEDLVHDVFVAAPSAFRNYRAEGSMRSFLFALTLRTVQHHVRSAQRRRGWLERFRADPVTHRADVPTPDEDLGRAALAIRLQHALDELSFEHRAVVVLCELEELTSPEAARLLDVPEGTVRTRLHHAKKRLREALGDLHE